MAYIVMAYVVIAYIVMACIVMAYVVWLQPSSLPACSLAPPSMWSTVYVHPLSGNALGAMLYVTEKRLPIKLEVVDILKGEQLQPWYTGR